MWKDAKLVRIFLVNVLDDVSKPVVSFWIHRCIRFYFFTHLEIEYFKIVVEDLLFFETLVEIRLDQVIPDFGDVIVIVNMTVHERIVAW